MGTERKIMEESEKWARVGEEEEDREGGREEKGRSRKSHRSGPE